MIIIGAIIFYVGFFGFLIGFVALLKGSIINLRINDRKQALKVIGLSIILAIVGSLIVGPEGKRTSDVSEVKVAPAYSSQIIG